MHITACLNSISVYTCTQTVDALPYWGNDNSENTYIYITEFYIFLSIPWFPEFMANKQLKIEIKLMLKGF